MALFIIFTLLIFFSSSYRGCGLAQKCIWNLNQDIPQQDPIYLQNSHPPKLLVPESQGLALNLGESTMLSCTGKSNVISGTNTQTATATCSTNNLLSFNGRLVTLKEINCTSLASSDLINTNTKCAKNRGNLFKIGFNNTYGMAELIEICYDNVFETVLYTTHTLYGEAIKAAEIDSARPSFRNTGLTYGTQTSDKYKQAEQKIRFAELLGSAQADRLINSTSYLARGHLAPDADFLFGTWAYASYYLVNAAPEWQAVNAGNWLRVEDLARDAADRRQEDLLVYDGVHDVLSLPDASGRLVEMYLLADGRLRVPKWYWKVLYSAATKQAIAFVTLNNPHATSVSSGELPCADVCGATNWTRPDWARLEKGYTICCDARQLIQVVQTMPMLEILAILMG